MLEDKELVEELELILDERFEASDRKLYWLGCVMGSWSRYFKVVEGSGAIILLLFGDRFRVVFRLLIGVLEGNFFIVTIPSSEGSTSSG